MKEKFNKWLKDNWPLWCVVCHTMVRTKNAKYERTNTGFKVPLCKRCHTAIFHPFTARAK